MSTVDSVFLIITGSAISLFFLIGIVALGVILKLVSEIRHVVAKAEGAIDSVETATEAIKNIGQNAGGPLAILKVINNILKIVNKK